MLVFCTVQVADAIVFEASLSFIGAGVRPPDPSWGSVIADGKDMVLTGGWWATVFPGLLILITVLSLNILSEGVSDAWAAPSAREVDGRAHEDRLEAPQPGSGEVLPTAGSDGGGRAAPVPGTRPSQRRATGARGREPGDRLPGPARRGGHRRRHQLRGARG